MSDKEIVYEVPEGKQEGKPVKRPSMAYLPVDSIITKSNTLIQKTRYSLPKTQQKILLAMIAKIDTQHDTDASKVYSLSFADFSKLTGVNVNSTSYIKFIKRTIEDLTSASFWMDAGPQKMKIYHWVADGAEIDTKAKKINLQFSPLIFPYLTQLKSNYTTFNVQYLLQMSSTYSMRFYELLLSYDNGDKDYGYNNGLVFQKLTPEVLRLFADRADELKGFRFKVFSVAEIKELLSPYDKQVASNPKKYKTLAQKYKNFHDFEKNVLVHAKQEINELTDLWFDYAAVRSTGSRAYDKLYIFIKYKTEKEMDVVKARYAEKAASVVLEHPRKRKGKQEPLGEPGNSEKTNEPISDVVFGWTVTKALRMLEAKAEIEEIKARVNEDIAKAAENALVYVARIITNKHTEKKAALARDTRDSLNRVLEQNGSLKTWAVGMGCYLHQKQQAGQLKSPQYNAAVVANAVEDMTIIPMGEKELKSGKRKDLFKMSMDMFDE